MSWARNKNEDVTPLQHWFFSDVLFQQLVNSFNVNARIVFDIPRNSHCWIVEELCGGKHAQQQIYSRYIKFVNTLATTHRDNVRSLFNIVSVDVRSQVGSNLRKLQLDTGITIFPGSTRPSILSNYRVYATPEHQEHILPLLSSLLEIRQSNWEVLFCEENGDLETLEENDVKFMIDELCTN